MKTSKSLTISGLHKVLKSRSNEPGNWSVSNMELILKQPCQSWSMHSVRQKAQNKWFCQNWTAICFHISKLKKLIHQFSSVQFSRSVMSDSLQPYESQHVRPPCLSPTFGVHSDSRPLSPWCHPPFHPLLSSSPTALNPSQHQGLFQWVNSSHEMAKVSEFQLQHQSFQWTSRTDLL